MRKWDRRDTVIRTAMFDHQSSSCEGFSVYFFFIEFQCLTFRIHLVRVSGCFFCFVLSSFSVLLWCFSVFSIVFQCVLPLCFSVSLVCFSMLTIVLVCFTIVFHNSLTFVSVCFTTVSVLCMHVCIDEDGEVSSQTSHTANSELLRLSDGPVHYRSHQRGPQGIHG